ncbi:MAG: glycosyltransferase [Actinomycetota bacterium]|nr:glycosyltransferase [Actinomycetota bacterium]
MSATAGQPTVLVAIPAFGSPDLTDAVLADLSRDGSLDDPRVAVVVVDNGADYVLPPAHASLTPAGSPRMRIHRPGRNLRWIGSANWALRTAVEGGLDVCVVLNNDTRLSPGFLTGLVAPFGAPDGDDVALVAACYDDFWIHQRATVIPASASDYVAHPALREVAFCDGTALAFAARRVVDLGALDEVAFPRHGYGSDIDLALRVRAAGLRCLVTEAAYVSHLRRATMQRTGQSSELNRSEILDGLDAKWPQGWRARAGLGPGSFPAHNTASAATWYLDPVATTTPTT